MRIGSEQAAQGVGGQQQEAEQQRQAEAAEQAAQAEVRVAGPCPGLVDVGDVGGGRECGDRARSSGVAGIPARAPATPGPAVAAAGVTGEKAPPEVVGGGSPVRGATGSGVMPSACGSAVSSGAFGRELSGGVGYVVVVAGEFVGVGEQAAVEGAAFLEFFVGADVDEPAAVEHRDPVGEGEGGAAVGDEQGGAAAHDLAQCVVDLGLDAGVHRGGGVVEQEEARVGEDRAGEGDALALAAGEGEALFADDGVVAVGQGGDEAVGLGGAGGGEHRRSSRGVGAAVGDVGAHGVGEQEAVLGDHADGARAASRW